MNKPLSFCHMRFFESVVHLATLTLHCTALLDIKNIQLIPHHVKAHCLLNKLERFNLKKKSSASMCSPLSPVGQTLFFPHHPKYSSGLDPKSIYQQTERATTNPRPRTEIFWRGESRSILTIFVLNIHFDLFFSK